MRRLLVLLIICLPLPVRAIVNIEAVRPKKSETGYTGQFKFEMGGSSGNTEKFRAGLGHNSVWNTGDYQNFVLLSYNYGESFEIKDTNKSFLHLRHVRPIQEDVFWELYTQSQTDEFKRLRLRALAGVGGRWELEQELTLWAIGAGLFYSHEELTEKGLLPEGTEDTARGNFYLSLKTQPDASLTGVLAIYFQPKLDEMSDHHAFASAMLKADWNESLAFAVEAELSHDNRPPEGVKKTDTTYTSSLIYKL
ncbi:MAG: DUF481 domain-containing protein [Bdellovibrionaceae bacterium]|nr:DUF481 domain-containing protein [Bdellovibrionales bacterium]MCB9084254.1 DUF481 domain-containing protein [Pseudobdellovibrionaceae bacterium]